MRRFLLLLALISLFTVNAKEKAEDIHPGEVLELIESDPVQSNHKAWEAYREEDYDSAISFYLHYLKHNIADENAMYNLACCYGLKQQQDLAADFLLQSFRNGFSDLSHARQDPDFEAVRSTPVFIQTLAEIELMLEKDKAAPADTVFLEHPVLQKALISIPSNFTKDRTYDLVIGLHGYGSNSHRFLKLMESCRRDSLIFIVPYAPHAFSVGKDIGYSWNIWVNDDEINRRSAENSQEYVLNCIDFMEQHYRIDQVYLFGFSQGAFLSFHMAVSHYDKFDGIIPFGGGVIEEEIEHSFLEEVSGIRIFAAHGRKDNVVDFARSETAVNLFRKQGIEVVFREFDGFHTVPIEILQEAFDWIRKR